MNEEEFHSTMLEAYKEQEIGKKFDAGKPRAGLVIRDFSLALSAVSEVGTFGANKYNAHDWLHVDNGVERYTDALYRHLLADVLADNDEDSGLRHLAHAAWNALAVLELTLRNERLV